MIEAPPGATSTTNPNKVEARHTTSIFQQHRLHPEVQQCDSLIHDLESLRCYQATIRGTSPLPTVNNDTVDLHQLSTWWSHADPDRVALWIPDQTNHEHNDIQYHTLTYAELSQELRKGPPFLPATIESVVTAASRDASSSLTTPPSIRVAIVVAAEDMAASATALLAVMAASRSPAAASNCPVTAVPLGPRLDWDAMHQLRCSVLVLEVRHAVESCGFTLDETQTTLILDRPPVLDEASSYWPEVHEIRLIEADSRGRLTWTIYKLSTSNSKKNGSPAATWTRVDAVASRSFPLKDYPEENYQREDAPLMLLRTSGTTAQPKVVPILPRHLLYAARTMATTLELTANDCNINAMPLYHIGGLSCNLLAVLVSGGQTILSGPLQDPRAFLHHIVVGHHDDTTSTVVPRATWYYASPAMHQALVLTARADPTTDYGRNHLRFCRSASAHLPAALARDLAQLFGCGVIPTYGMSEAMPICSSRPLYCYKSSRNDDDTDQEVVDSVGYPIGSHVKIVHPETFQTLPRTTHPENDDDNDGGPSVPIGEICVSGAGVIPYYEGLPSGTGFTPDGWLRTGDLGYLDHAGRLFIKGRSKEMIKRGGEQIWPNQVDSVIQSVEGVATVVTFGVPNPLLGEEVATAVVPTSHVTDLQELERRILERCQSKLEANAVPQQLKFVASKEELLTGATGKFLRSKMADHLQLEAVETGALRILEMAARKHTDLSECQNDIMDDDVWEKAKDCLDATCYRVTPDASLNGLRFLIACCVVNTHVSLYPNLAWVKLQSYTPNMMIFFALGVFQTSCSVGKPVQSQWSTWVGTKIGSLHALFVLSQLVTLPSYLLWSCTDEEGDHNCTAGDYVSILLKWIVGTSTGMVHGLDGNYFTWFQSTFYIFLIFFPFVDQFLRRYNTRRIMLCLLTVSLVATIAFVYVAGAILPNDFFAENIWLAQYSIVSWAPYLLASMCAAYLFRVTVEAVVTAPDKRFSDLTEVTDTSEGDTSYEMAYHEQSNDIDVVSIMEMTRLWGWICDACSLVLLALFVAVAAVPSCMCLKQETAEDMRGLDMLNETSSCPHVGSDHLLQVCDISYEEFITFIHPDVDYFARFETTLSLVLGQWRGASPLFLLWIFSMAFGNGITSRLFRLPILQALAPLCYPVYLLQMPVARYYWMATRGLESQDWWVEGGIYAFPVNWYEYWLILGSATLLGYAINHFLVPRLMPHTIYWGVWVCSRISECVKALLRKFHLVKDSSSGSPTTSVVDDGVFPQIKALVLGLTGVEVTPEIELKRLGLDSLGATALLGMLRSSIPAAHELNVRQLRSCNTVDDLVKMLEGAV